jgi:hypothetical protein
MKFGLRIAAGLVAGVAAAGPAGLQAQAIISNGTVQLGVDTRGQLNIPGPGSAAGTSYVGLRYVPTNMGSTEAGCLCEGWGAGIAGGGFSSGVHGYSNNAAGNFNVTPVSFASTASTATSIVTIGGVLEVTHLFQPSAKTANLYEVVVTMRNLTDQQLGSGANGLRYTRTMDWDIEPTPFSEFVTLQGWGAANLLQMGTNGFSTGSVFNTAAAAGCPTPINQNVDSRGPCDHGAEFYFGFDALAAFGSHSFSIFYGAAANKSQMLAALGSVGAEVYSLATCNPALDVRCTAEGGPNTFAFGFVGVGGEPQLPDPTVVPEPMSMVLLGTGLAGVAAARRRRRQTDVPAA